jgi:hypothetical protein
MHRGVSKSHDVSQKKLKGSPSTMGSTRSQRETEKQVAVKGIKPKNSAPSDGGFKRVLLEAS